MLKKKRSLGKGTGVTGVFSGSDEISLFEGSLVALQEHAETKYPGMKICFASSADTPFAEKVGRATLKLLEVVPGLTVWDLALRDFDGEDVNQIGRQPPLSRYEGKKSLFTNQYHSAHRSFTLSIPKNHIFYVCHFSYFSNKSLTHFPRIREITGIPYDKMLFFDDWYVFHIFL